MIVTILRFLRQISQLFKQPVNYVSKAALHAYKLVIWTVRHGQAEVLKMCKNIPPDNFMYWGHACILRLLFSPKNVLPWLPQSGAALRLPKTALVRWLVRIFVRAKLLRSDVREGQTRLLIILDEACLIVQAHVQEQPQNNHCCERKLLLSLLSSLMKEQVGEKDDWAISLRTWSFFQCLNECKYNCFLHLVNRRAVGSINFRCSPFCR